MEKSLGKSLKIKYMAGKMNNYLTAITFSSDTFEAISFLYDPSCKEQANKKAEKPHTFSEVYYKVNITYLVFIQWIKYAQWSNENTNCYCQLPSSKHLLLMVNINQKRKTTNLQTYWVLWGHQGKKPPDM